MSSNFRLYPGQCEFLIVEILDSILFLCRKLVFVSKQFTWLTLDSSLLLQLKYLLSYYILNSTPCHLCACGFQRSVGYVGRVYMQNMSLFVLVFPLLPPFAVCFNCPETCPLLLQVCKAMDFPTNFSSPTWSQLGPTFIPMAVKLANS